MQVHQIKPVAASRADQKPAVRRPEKQEEDAAQFPGSAQLDAALANTPDIRQGEVDRARELVNSPQYPPAAAIHSIARLLAIQMKDLTS